MSVRKRSRRAHLRAESPRRSVSYRLLIVMGAVLVGATVAWQLQATLWNSRSQRVGNAIVKHERTVQRAVVAGHGHGLCTTKGAQNSGTAIMEIPAISLTAPVEQGTGDAVLNVAVGHDPYSVWPGTNGTAVFDAHDVSYFLNLNHLHRGDLIRYQTSCTQYEFQVQSGAIVKAGTTVYNTPGPSVTLVTCWPTNALWFTPDRYIVTAVEIGKTSITSTASSQAKSAGQQQPPAVPLPVALAAQGLTLATNYIPMGTMNLTGSPSRTWAQSPGPLNTVFAALEAYIGGLHSLAQGRIDWWHALAPGIAEPQPLIGATVSYLAPLDVFIEVASGSPLSTTLQTKVTLSGGKQSGSYAMTVRGVIRDSKLTISNWQLAPS